MLGISVAEEAHAPTKANPEWPRTFIAYLKHLMRACHIGTLAAYLKPCGQVSNPFFVIVFPGGNCRTGNYTLRVRVVGERFRILHVILFRLATRSDCTMSIEPVG